MTAQAIMLHAFVEDADGSTYCEPDDASASGWCVYIRSEKGADGFDVGEETDCATYELAKAHADQLAVVTGLELHEY